MLNAFFTLVLTVVGILPLLALISAVYLPRQSAFPNILITPRREASPLSPRILNPSHQTVWSKGARQAVTWKTTDIPPQTGNPDCQKIPSALHRWVSLTRYPSSDQPLASHCKLRDGNTALVVPQEDWVAPARNYVVIRGNSPLFTIAGPPENKPRYFAVVQA
ncbi:hypothetical protein AGABI2DRAFT_119244 [Agaricus bisporus var. bisporus H97]|uniref:hypothetical protein n=1 Tax=Agaricus bisporus var. bisporus (strain H97 / ATCC MYA-4626 / FGSC 10389) TaxID=936046 RepID=UPI00029F6B08|nr:hypothetical protein AGABI2DRAFT_119244 [Agaricus bisporus var. bisporus H97]EKV45562.1 hypothetical protein AGABI2DRAFT_119244 [Agaricus bisporus var. bisporus H97]